MRKISESEYPSHFWSHVQVRGENDCWEWTYHRSPRGYGWVGFKGSMKQAHRVAYILTLGEIPDALCVCHTCDNPPCCNPSHLFLGTHQDNMTDRKNKNRSARNMGEKNGQSKLTRSDVIDILHRHHNGETEEALAKEKNVSQSTVSKIVLGNSWKSVH